MEMEEHIYQDDPNVGPADVQTNPPGLHYFFVGNGHILAAVQVSTSEALTAIGLLIMSPDRFGPKRQSLSMDPENGLQATQIEVMIDPYRFQPDPRQLQSSWIFHQGVPAAKVSWATVEFSVNEIFFCPDRDQPRLVRMVQFENFSDHDLTLSVQTGLLQHSIAQPISLPAKGTGSVFFLYELRSTEDRLEAVVSISDAVTVKPEASAFWRQLSNAQSDAPILDHLLQTAVICLQHVISAKGAVDASIWQYNLEWVRDHSMMALGLIMSGNYELAKILLARLLTQFVGEQGDTVDSSRHRPIEDIELDQNGELLLAIRTYVDFTGDLAFAQEHWEKIEKVAEFPLQRVFLHKESGLLHNQREFWERHGEYGIKQGMELTYQLYVSMGLACAAYLAEQLEKKKQSERWFSESERIKQAMLTHPKFRLIEHGHFIKRRQMNGVVQSEIMVHPNVVLPPGVPVSEAPPHFLNPDSSITLPIAWEFIDAKSDLARHSLYQVERLWNQRWSIGGYGRYHVSSEADSPGPWPFAGLFIARAYFENGQDEKVWRVLNWLNAMTGAISGSWFEFYGPRPCPPCPQVGIIPWTWAELLLFFIHHLWGLRPSKELVRIRPRLLSSMNRMQACFMVQGCRITVKVNRCVEGQAADCLVDGEPYPYTTEQGLKLSLKSKSDFHIEIHQY